MNIEYALSEVDSLRNIDPDDGVHWAVVAEIIADAYREEKAEVERLKREILELRNK